MTTCSGITARPLDVKQVSLEAARQVVPDILYWLIRFLVTGEAGKTNCPSQCSNTSNERQILSSCQDIIHCSTNGRLKTPKHGGLAITVHHLTSSRRLITLLNKMGHCSSYDEMRAIDTSAPLEVLAKANDFGAVIPSNVSLYSNHRRQQRSERGNVIWPKYEPCYYNGGISEKGIWSRSAPAPLVDHTMHQAKVFAVNVQY